MDTKKCRYGKDHSLIDVFTVAKSNHNQVVARWCEICGSVIVDEDDKTMGEPYEGARWHTKSGAIMAMKSPEIAKKRLFSIKEIEQAIETAKEMVIDANLEEKTKIVQMAGYIRWHLIEMPQEQ